MCGLTFELSGPEPGWCLGREANAKPERLAAQVSGRTLVESVPDYLGQKGLIVSSEPLSELHD